MIISFFKNPLHNAFHFAHVYRRSLSMTFTYALTHRTNFLIQNIFAPVYVLMMYGVLQTVMSKTPTLFGWTSVDLNLSLSILNLTVAFSMFSYVQTIRHMMWMGVNQGEVDPWLTRPLPAPLSITLLKPGVDSIVFLLGSVVYFFVAFAHASLQPWHILQFLLVFPLCLFVNYLTFSTYLPIAFFSSKSQQILELIDKTSDYAHYPPEAFAPSVRFITASFIPTIYFAYVPSAILLGKASATHIFALVVITGAFWFLRKLLWKKGLEQYSGVSI